MGKLVIIACSTGGPKALQEIVPELPADLKASVLIVQHMPEGFTKSLAMRLDESSHLTVLEAKDNQIIEEGQVYFAKGGMQLRVKETTKGKAKLFLSDETAKHGLRPCADVLLKSLVNTSYDPIVCVVLTGMGDDSLEGISYLKETKNIYVITQDKETSTVYGMPKSVYEAGLSDQVVPLHKMADVITKLMEVH